MYPMRPPMHGLRNTRARMSPNMSLTTTQIVEKHERDQKKAAIAKAQNQAMTLRAVEYGTGAVTYAGLEALEEWKPEWFGYQIPRIAVSVAGLGMFMFAGKSDLIREVGAGMTIAGTYPLLGLAAKKGVAALLAA